MQPPTGQLQAICLGRGCDPQATLRPPSSHPQATHKPPSCDPHATLMRPTSHPKATKMRIARATFLHFGRRCSIFHARDSTHRIATTGRVFAEAESGDGDPGTAPMQEDDIGEGDRSAGDGGVFRFPSNILQLRHLGHRHLPLLPLHSACSDGPLPLTPRQRPGVYPRRIT